MSRVKQKPRTDVRQVLFKSVPRPEKQPLLVVLQRKRGRWAITLERGTTSGSPWLAVPIQQVPALSVALVQAYQILSELQRHGAAEGLVFPILVRTLRRNTGASLKTIEELRVRVEEFNGHYYVDLAVSRLDGEEWLPPSQRVTVGFTDIEPVQAALEYAIKITHHGHQVNQPRADSGSRSSATPPPFPVKGR